MSSLMMVGKFLSTNLFVNELRSATLLVTISDSPLSLLEVGVAAETLESKTEDLTVKEAESGGGVLTWSLL